MAKALVLRAITGMQAGQRHTLTARSNTVGTSPGNDIVLHDRMLEPRHAEIKQVLERWFIVPAPHATQGMALNGMPIRGQSRLNAGDALSIGSITYVVELEEVVEQEVGTGHSSGTSGVPKLGEYFIRRGLLSPGQVQRVVERQSDLAHNGSRLPFGQVAFDLGYITRSQLDTALADQRQDFNERFWD